MSSSFLDLPDDILFNVVQFLQVPDILSARKTCKRLQAITMSRNVWTTMYKMSRSDNSFFPPVISLGSQTIPDLERLLWRAHQLDTLWEIGPSPHYAPKEIWAIDTAPGSYFGNVEIYQGRYLIIQTSPSIAIYDVETKHEIFRQETGRSEGFNCKVQSHIVDENAEFYLAFRTRSSSGKTMSILKMNTLGVVAVTHDYPALRQFYNGSLVIGNEFAIVNSTFIIHLPSQKVYPLSSMDIGRPDLAASRTVTFVSGGYFLVYADWPHDVARFILYRLPDPAAVQAGTPVQPTHRGTLHQSVRISYAFLASNISSSGSSGFIWMFFISSNFDQLQLLRIALQPDGHLSLRATSTGSGRDRRMQNTFWTHPADGKIRVVTRMAADQQEWGWVLYDASVDLKGELRVHTSAINIPKHRCFDILTLDASRGILAVVPNSSYNEICVLDLVGR